MTEQLRTSPEHEHSPKDLESERQKQLERLERSHEKENTASPEKSIEETREKLKEVAAEQEKKEVAKNERLSVEQPKKRQLRTKQSLKAAFNSEMKDARSQMSAPSRAFSKLIHSKPVEKTSEAIGSTIARPNAILSGSLAALILTTSLYFWAQYVGYPLSGFETIGAFLIGWIVGLIIDFVRILFTGKS